MVSEREDCRLSLIGSNSQPARRTPQKTSRGWRTANRAPADFGLFVRTISLWLRRPRVTKLHQRLGDLVKDVGIVDGGRHLPLLAVGYALHDASKDLA